MTIKLIVFDMDGVLIQEKCYASVLFEKLYGIPHEEFYQVIKDHKILEITRDKGPNFKLFLDLLEKYNVEISEEKFWGLWLKNFQVKKRVLDFALQIKDSGKRLEYFLIILLKEGIILEIWNGLNSLIIFYFPVILELLRKIPDFLKY
jgi:FMN phosphatase YigB (HAD superfamily)